MGTELDVAYGGVAGVYAQSVSLFHVCFIVTFFASLYLPVHVLILTDSSCIIIIWLHHSHTQSLWWRYLQNLRQCYDAKQRWPYLGNALKYLLAAEVAIFGVFDPSVKKSPLWMTCFFVATMYQVWWDVFMDWGLLERDPSFGYNYFHATNSNGVGRSWLWWWPYSLRSQRLYRRKWVYHVIFGINLCLRFVGMITLIPPVYLSRSAGLIVNTFNDTDFQLFVGSLVASAEIFRRTIWALLRLEWEVIRTSSSEGSRKNKDNPMDNDDRVDNLLEEEEMKPMAISSSGMVADREHEQSWSFTAKRIFSLV